MIDSTVEIRRNRLPDWSVHCMQNNVQNFSSSSIKFHTSTPLGTTKETTNFLHTYRRFGCFACAAKQALQDPTSVSDLGKEFKIQGMGRRFLKLIPTSVVHSREKLIENELEQREGREK